MDEKIRPVGRRCDLRTVAEVKEWLRRPENQIRSSTFIIKWDGATPSISVHPTNRLADLEENDGLATVVLCEHIRKKARVLKDLEPEDD
jgi:hypothetical protein